MVLKDGIRKPARTGPNFGSKILTVFVGERKDPFIVHRDLICTSSPFFRAACNGPWKEREGIITLPADNPEMLDIYIKWLYVKKVFTAEESFDSGEWQRLHNSYVFGDKLQDTRFKNAIIDAIIETIISTKKYPAGLAEDIWGNTPESSPWRKLYIDFWAYCGRPEWFKNKRHGRDVPNAPKEFWLDLAKKQALLNGRPPSSECPWVKTRCEYHEHAEGEPKCTT